MMKYNRLFFFFILMSLIGHACAHDPGFSTAIITVSEDRLVTTVVFSQDDINGLVLMDTDRSGIISQSEFIASQAKLKALVKSSIKLSSKDGAGASIDISPEDMSVALADSNALNIVLRFKLLNNEKSIMAFPIIEKLSRGHRLYAVIRGRDGNKISQQVLGVNNSTLNIGLSKPGQLSVFIDYLKEGVVHIWGGADHLLFLITLLLPSVMIYRNHRWHGLDSLRPAIIDTLKIVTAFTLAHSITLFLAVMELVIFPMRLIESLIALSVVLTALNNIYPMFKTSRWSLAFVFGLVHGFGFANALQGLDLQTDALAVSLLGFNLGVELGQLVVVFIFFPAIALARHTVTYRTWGLGAGSFAVLMVACVWVFERTLDVEIINI